MSKKILFSFPVQPISEKNEQSTKGIIKKISQRKFTDQNIIKSHKRLSSVCYQNPDEVESINEYYMQRRDSSGNPITLNGSHRICFSSAEPQEVVTSEKILAQSIQITKKNAFVSQVIIFKSPLNGTSQLKVQNISY